MRRKQMPSAETTLSSAIRESYGRGEEDEALEPIILVDKSGTPVGRFKNGDYVIFYDIRGEREIELTASLVDPNFDNFPIDKELRLHFVTMIEYDKRLPVRVAFPPGEPLRDTLSEVLSKHGLTHLKLAESEKAIHVCFFLNGKADRPFPGEERLIIPSPPNLSNYDQKPEMSIKQVAEAAIEKIRDPRYALIITNFANVDVVGHIENDAAINKAVELVDYYTGRVVEASLKAGRGVIVTADHGTVEKWLYPEGTINTGHTDSPVPFILLLPDGTHREVTLSEKGELSDVAPTILELLGLPQPQVMTGRSLLLNYSPSKNERVKNLLLLILDGWGFNDEQYGNLIAQAHTPVMDELWSKYPSTRLKASGSAVGMPEGTVGNSEAGHLHLGAGRCVHSDRWRIDQAIEKGTFFSNEAFLWAMGGAKSNNRPLHLLGIVSFYSSHGSLDYLCSLLKMAADAGLKEVYIHSLLGRRGERPESGAIYIEKVEDETRKLGLGKVVTVMGRYWALDREENWDRVEKTYRALVYGEGRKVKGEDG
ncbi:MAG: phosphoglycerate mutase (2,3-diphosphoglycerate-independent) [Candidatus Aminicenantes bacterium]|nr:phosphoglycerate mutase (2,3-diphosphoglycerate-independent) [Candidatus Aminicenantes bacterium]